MGMENQHIRTHIYIHTYYIQKYILMPPYPTISHNMSGSIPTWYAGKRTQSCSDEACMAARVIGRRG